MTLKMVKILEQKLEYAFKYQWDENIKTKYELIFENEKIGLKFFRLDDIKNWILIHYEKPIVFDNEDTINDFLSRSLTSFLKSHVSWKKKVK